MENSGAAGIGIVGTIIYLAIVVLLIVSLWKLYAKAGKPGWAAIIPIYNIIVLLEIVKRPIWWIILLFIPIVNFIALIIIYVDFVKAYGKPAWHIILVLLFSFIYFPYLAFSDAKYVL
jgi:hypothetical protein